MKLPDFESDRVPVDPGPVSVGQRIKLLGLLADPEVALEHHRRADDLRVVRADATIRVQVMRIEEPPLRRARRDLAATLIGVPILEREVEAVVRRRFPVDAHDVVHLRVLGVLLRRVVELSLREIPVEVVGAREHVQQRLAVRVDAVRRDDVVREARRTARDGITRPRRQWVPDVDQFPIAVERLREISLHLPIGRHRPVPDGAWPAYERSLQ